MALLVFENEYFALVKEGGIGMNDTPWTGLKVQSKGIAEKHVVEIRLNHVGYQAFDGTPVVYQYSDAYVGHGMRMQADTLQETQEYIKALQEAVKFAEKVNNWLFKNDYHA